MKMVTSYLLVGLCLTSLTQSVEILDAFRSHPQHATGPVEDSCIAHAHSGDCQFYVCFERRHQCESHNYALDYGWRFCTRFDTHWDRLTAEGQRWQQGTRRCSMERMLDFYRDDVITCGEVASAMKDQHASCEVENGLCSAGLINDNRQVLTDVFTLNRRSAVQFMHAVKHCAVSKFTMVSEWFSERVGSLPSLPSSLDELQDRLEDLGDSVMDGLRDLFSDDDDE